MLSGYGSYASASTSTSAQLSLAEALEWDAQGGEQAWLMVKQIEQALEQACGLNPADLRLAARLLNFYAPTLTNRHLALLTSQLLALGPVDAAMVSHWLLPSAALFADYTQPTRTQQLMDLVPARYRCGSQWERLAHSYELAVARQQARDSLRQLYLDMDRLSQEAFERHQRELKHRAYPEYEALAWPYVNRYPQLRLATGCIESETVALQ